MPLTIHFGQNLAISGMTQDIRLNSLLLVTDYQPKWQLLDETDYFELQDIR